MPVIVQDEIIHLNEILQKAVLYGLPSKDEREFDEGLFKSISQSFIVMDI